MIRISLIDEARMTAKQCLIGGAGVMLKNNVSLTDEQKIELADFYLLDRKLTGIVEDLYHLRSHCLHGTNGTAPELWNAFGDGGEYDAHDAVFKTSKLVETLWDFPLNVLEFIRHVPAIEKGIDEYLNEVHQHTIVKGQTYTTIEKLSPEERVQNIQDRYLERLEKSFGLEEWFSDIKKVQIIAITKGDLNEVLSLVQE